MSIRRNSLSILALVAATVLLSACSAPAEESADSTPADTETSAVKSSETAASESTSLNETPPPKTVEATADGSEALSPLGSPDLEDKSTIPGAPSELIPVGIRVADHGSFTRVVLDFEGSGEASWFTQMTSDPAQQASGHPIDYEGSTAINIGIESTPWPSTPELEEAYMDFGTTDGAGVVTGVEFVTSFEAQSQYVIGLEKQSPYSITFLEGPPRVVIDIMN